jgi:hypothetical protein
MKSNIHIETPDGEVINQAPAGKTDDKKTEAAEKEDVAANAAGAKSNPDPRANANLKENEKKGADEGTGTEITDGEGG